MHIVQKFIVVAAAVSAIGHFTTRVLQRNDVVDVVDVAAGADAESVTASWTAREQQSALQCDAEDLEACEGMPAGVIVTGSTPRPAAERRPSSAVRGAATHKLHDFRRPLCARRPMSDMSTSTAP
jgi:hypothetical protein